MRNLLYLLTGTVTLLSYGVAAGKHPASPPTVNCNGNNDDCSIHPQRRDVRSLFGRQGSVGHQGALAAPSGGKGKAGGGAKALAGGKTSGGGGGKGKGAGGDKSAHERPLYIIEIVEMINNNQQLPKALQPHVQKKAKELGLNHPDPATQKPPPPHLAGHPCPEALKKLHSDNIPKEILDAAKAAWGGSGKGHGGKGHGGKKSGASKKGGSSTKGASPAVQRRDPYAYAYADADAEAEAEAYDFYLAERGFEADDFELDLSGRDLDEAEFDLYARDLEGDDFFLYERDLNADAFEYFA